MITFDQVREELLAIIDSDPTRHGYIAMSADDDPILGHPPMACRYFETDNPESPPCCIVGFWINGHRELIDVVFDMIVANDAANSLHDIVDLPVTPDARDLLIYAQDKQDHWGITWADIREDIANATPESVSPREVGI